ncbi:sensor domain-containing diguanylate cyclase [Massilia sp. CFBP9026]|uniref:GGDEF domain-containing protein n=1 Tax=Massilia sp. CFBP9026 TaxID=3096536 RepID=UPI002A6A9F15|nr:sensor domain-containing diguanylate cyclase [Massilia sp. CFBP9026]MDY0964644.1 sensor domain-containing diguanylate cyclase [Massilia sp. CFBP9026]
MNPSTDNLDTHVDRLSGKRRPVVRLVVAATALGCSLLVAFAAWFIWSSRHTQIQQTEVATSNVARMVGVQVETAMKATTMALANVVERVEHDGTDAAAMKRLQAHLVVLTRTTPELHGIFVYAADGRWLASSLIGTPQGDNSDRAYFQHHRTHASRDIYVGHPVRSRSTGVWVLPISRRIDHPDGSFAGVALVTLKVNFFERIYDELDVGKTGTVLLALEDGTVIYRRPFDDKLIGTNLAGGAIFKAIRDNAVGSDFLVARIDNIERLYSYRRVDDFAFVIAVGQTKDELLGPWKRSSMLIGAAVVLIAAVFALFARKLIRQFAIRDRLDQKLRAYSHDLRRDNLGLQELAHTDKLTQLANRRRFDEVLAHELRHARIAGTPTALLLLDVDYFKKFNDRYGHPAGDACLQEVGRILAAQVNRNRDLPARYGGEEFAVILPDTELAGALAVAERLRHEIQALQLPHQESPSGVVTASIGVAVLVRASGSDVDPGELVAHADRHLYNAKHAGRNRVDAGPAT